MQLAGNLELARGSPFQLGLFSGSARAGPSQLASRLRSYPDPNLTFGYVPQLSWLSLIQMGISFTKNLRLSHLLANVPSRISDLHLDFKSEKVPTLFIHVL